MDDGAIGSARAEACLAHGEAEAEAEATDTRERLARAQAQAAGRRRAAREVRRLGARRAARARGGNLASEGDDVVRDEVEEARGGARIDGRGDVNLERRGVVLRDVGV